MGQDPGRPGWPGAGGRRLCSSAIRVMIDRARRQPSESPIQVPLTRERTHHRAWVGRNPAPHVGALSNQHDRYSHGGHRNSAQDELRGPGAVYKKCSFLTGCGHYSALPKSHPARVMLINNRRALACTGGIVAAGFLFCVVIINRGTGLVSLEEDSDEPKDYYTTAFPPGARKGVGDKYDF